MNEVHPSRSLLLIFRVSLRNYSLTHHCQSVHEKLIRDQQIERMILVSTLPFFPVTDRAPADGAFTYPYGHLNTFELAYGPRGWFVKFPFGTSNTTAWTFLQTTTTALPVVKWNSTWRYTRRFRTRIFPSFFTTRKTIMTTMTTTIRTTTTTIPSTTATSTMVTTSQGNDVQTDAMIQWDLSTFCLTSSTHYYRVLYATGNCNEEYSDSIDSDCYTSTGIVNDCWEEKRCFIRTCTRKVCC